MYGHINRTRQIVNDKQNLIRKLREEDIRIDAERKNRCRKSLKLPIYLRNYYLRSGTNRDAYVWIIGFLFNFNRFFSHLFEQK